MNKMKKNGVVIISIFILLILFSSQLYAQENTENNYFEKKDPLFAAILSWYMPGMGLFYTDSFFRGILYYSVENLLAWYTLSQIAEVQTNLGLDQIIGLNLFGFTTETFDPTKLKNVGWLTGLYVGIRILSIVDSAFTAYSYNIAHEDDTPYNPKISPFIAGLLSWVFPGVGQFYIKDYFTGSIFIFIDFLQKAYMIVILSSQFPNAEEPIEELGDLGSINWTSLSAATKIIIITYALLYVGNRSVASIMAYNKAKTNFFSSSYSTLAYPFLTGDSVGFMFQLVF